MILAYLLSAFIAFLPFIAFGVSYGLQKATHSPTTNGIISLVTILVAAIITAFLQGDLTGNAKTDTSYVLALATALQVETFRPLQGYLRGDPPEHDAPRPVPPPVIIPAPSPDGPKPL